MLTEIATDTALKRLPSCSTALFWEVLGHMRVPPLGIGKALLQAALTLYPGETRIMQN